jgi:hypothetical protein
MTRKRQTAHVALLAATAVTAGAMAATGQSLTEIEFANGGSLISYGQINEAYLYFDDGDHKRGFLPVGNANSSTRAGVTYQLGLSGDADFFANAEFQYIPRGSNTVNFEDPYPGDSAYDLDRTDIRKIEIRFASPTWGRLWLGQGSMASDGISEIDLSSTGVTAYSAIADTAGGFFFREEDGELSDITIGSAYSNLDGSRRTRARYDTPELAGLTLSVAYGIETLQSNNDNKYTDAALRYQRSTDTLQVQAGVGYNWIDVDGGDNREFYSGSAALLHKPTGLNGAIAGGSNVDADGNFGYAKLGIIRAPFALGSTALSVDYGYGDEFAGDDGKLTTWSLAAVQDWDSINAQIYLLYRNHTFNDDAADYDDGYALFSGIRWRF